MGLTLRRRFRPWSARRWRALAGWWRRGSRRCRSCCPDSCSDDVASWTSRGSPSCCGRWNDNDCCRSVLPEFPGSRNLPNSNDLVFYSVYSFIYVLKYVGSPYRRAEMHNKSKTADGRHFKNIKIAISSERFKLSQRNFTRPYFNSIGTCNFEFNGWSESRKILYAGRIYQMLVLGWQIAP